MIFAELALSALPKAWKDFKLQKSVRRKHSAGPVKKDENASRGLFIANKSC